MVHASRKVLREDEHASPSTSHRHHRRAGGCEWIAGIENTIIGVDAMRPADAALAPDASMTNPPDGGGASPDASVDCPGPCFVDDNAFEDFDAIQGGVNGRWRYVEFLPHIDSYVDMAFFTFPDAVTGWTGTGTPAPSIAYCPAGVTTTPRLEQQGFLALTTTAPDAHHPALTWTAPAPGAHTVSAF